MKVHYFQHVPFEGLGYIESWLQQHHHSITSTRFFEAAYVFPEMGDLDALIVMGGPMGVYDEQAFPWLMQEKVFIDECLKSGKKILGICLGAQLLASCLGAEVGPAPHKEIGWFPVKPADGVKASWLTTLFLSDPVIFHWHGDQFGIPGDAEDILQTTANSRQAFCLDNQVMGFQFHLEVTPEGIAQMVRHGADELMESPFIQNAQHIQSMSHLMQAGHGIMSKVLEHWMDIKPEK